MADGESNLSVQLFVELKGKFPHVSELQLQNIIKQFSNNREKCLETLTKDFSNLSTPSSSCSSPLPATQPSTNHPQVSQSWISYNRDSSTYSSNVKPWTPYRKPDLKPSTLTPDFEPFINHSPDSSTIPNIKCQSSPPVRQIAVQHITTSKPDSANTHGICKSPSTSPINGNQRNWYPSQHHHQHHHQSQKSHEVLITPSSAAPSSSSPSPSTQHYAKAQLFIDPPNWNVINPGAPGATCVISSNPRLQPSQLITLHSPEPGSQPAGLYSPQPAYGGHGSSELFTAIAHTPSPSPWLPDMKPMFSGSQYIPVKVQPPTTSPSSPSTPHHISSTTYHTMPSSQQSNTTSTLIHYPALRVNTSPGQPANSSALEPMKNRAPNPMPILPPVSPSDNVQMARPRNGSLQDDTDYTNALITHQRLRYDKLNEDYKLLLGHCKELEEEIENLAQDKKECYSKLTFPTESDVLKLRNSTESLRMEIFSLAKELDAYDNGLTPIGVLDPLEQQHFYKNMNTGQSGSIFASSTSSSTPQSLNSWGNAPPRPPRYMPESAHPVPPPLEDNLDLCEESWDCSECTYKNHQAMDKCEMCEIPRRNRKELRPSP